MFWSGCPGVLACIATWRREDGGAPGSRRQPGGASWSCDGDGRCWGLAGTVASSVRKPPSTGIRDAYGIHSSGRGPPHIDSFMASAANGMTPIRLSTSGSS